MNVRICGVVTAKTMRDLRRIVKKAERDEAHIIEVRLDYLQEKCNLREVRRLTHLPLIATNRLHKEGGFFQGIEEDRISILLDAAESDFDFIDVELSTKNSEEVVKTLKALGVKIIVSTHFFTTTPSFSKINQIFKRELDIGGDVCKIVSMARRVEDNLTCLQFVAEVSKKTAVICFCMGKRGISSRVLSPLFGGYLTYASVERGGESAVGQLDLSEMRRIYELMGINLED